MDCPRSRLWRLAIASLKGSQSISFWSRSHRIHPDHEVVADLLIQCQTSGMLACYAEAIRQVAAEQGVTLADVHAEWVRWQRANVDTDLWLVNGLNHPGEQGHWLAKTLLLHALVR